jgi:hypothetical protein
MGASTRRHHTLGNRYVDAGKPAGENVIGIDRPRRWTYTREPGHPDSPYVVRAEGKLICRVRSVVDADLICFGRTSALRDAGQRAADLRRFRLQLRQMQDDVRVLMQALEEVGQVLRLIKPRDVIRARENVRKVRRKMHGRGYAR